MNYGKGTLTELRAAAKECGIKGYSKLKKKELLELLKSKNTTTIDELFGYEKPRLLLDIRKDARALGVKKTSSLTKDKLLQRIALKERQLKVFEKIARPHIEISANGFLLVNGLEMAPVIKLNKDNGRYEVYIQDFNDKLEWQRALDTGLVIRHISGLML